MPCKSILALELLVRPDNSPLRMNGSGMLILNAPFRIDLELASSLSKLVELLDDGGASHHIEWLKSAD